MKISVVVCAKNEEKIIESCLRNLSKQIVRPEIIVVDGWSSDNTVKISKKYAKVVKDNKKGLGEARNVGWKAAKGDIIAYCDADSRPKKDWAKKICELIEDCDCVSGPLISYDGSRIMKINFKVWADLFPRFLSFFGLNMVWGANMAFKKKILKKYRFRLRFLEDYDIGQRFRNDKKKIKFSKEISLPVSSRRFQEGFCRTCFKYYVIGFLKIKLFGKRDSGYY